MGNFEETRDGVGKRNVPEHKSGPFWGVSGALSAALLPVLTGLNALVTVAAKENCCQQGRLSPIGTLRKCPPSLLSLPSSPSYPFPLLPPSFPSLPYPFHGVRNRSKISELSEFLSLSDSEFQAL